MGWIGGSRVILLVTRVAQCTVQRVVAVDVAIRALPRRNDMRTGQREAGGGVIEFAIGPRDGVVAALACRWEFRSDVVHRCDCVVVVVLMATHAGGARQVVVVIDVAVGAQPRRNGVRTRQGEPCAGVIEFAVGP